MQMYLKEKIGKPELFSGRRHELTYLLKWVNGVRDELSKSTAMLARRKTGKTALLQRLYNIVFELNDGIIPFYFEVREGKQWAVAFCEEFFLTFVYQYLAFKTRQHAYIALARTRNLTKAIDDVKTEGYDYLADLIEDVQFMIREENVDRLWGMVKDIPRTVAESQDERVVQLIDEFQYLNKFIYRDKAATQVMDDFAGGYMSTAEYRNAPLLISGSWVGWLRHLLWTMLPSRFKHWPLDPMPEDEAVEMIFNYARLLNLPVTEEIAYVMAELSEGNPFYISALFYSMFRDKDFTTLDGLLETLEFETLNDRGEIKSTWMEYVGTTFSEVNERQSKNIVLYLCKHRDREVTRKELLDTLRLEMTDRELEQKLHALVKADIIEQGQSNFYYRGVQDNIFDKVFRGEYADDIAAFDPQAITHEYKALFEQSQHRYRQLLGKFNYTKGLYAEYAIIDQLRYHAWQQPQRFAAMMQNLPEDFHFVQYNSVWSYKTVQPNQRDINIDIFARAGADSKQAYSLIWEVKNRDTKAFNDAEAEEFVAKAQRLQERESLGKTLLVVFSRKGFTQAALEFFQAHGLAWSDDDEWLGDKTFGN